MTLVMKTCFAFVLSFGVSAILLKIFIPILRKAKLGQKILEIGPSWHKCKEGTPTMGGLFFIIGIFVSAGIFLLPADIKRGDYSLLIHMLFALSYGLVGFVDDYVKLFKKQNKGLTAWQKLAIQVVATVAYLAILVKLGYVDTTLKIPFMEKGLELGVLYYPICTLAIMYLVNCANLTDGVDGLAGSVSAVIFFFFALLSYKLFLTTHESLFVLAVVCLGAILAFLVFNFHPAKVFMGDTGSQFIGAMVVGMCFWVNAGIWSVIICFIYLIEGISVILQVGSFKLTGKRIFKMAPIHHHFEKCGWSEVRIVFIFSVVTALFCGFTFFLFS
jgi:phospho-N-acetylmuramoyl-pentapeptide-transferase